MNHTRTTLVLCGLVLVSACRAPQSDNVGNPRSASAEGATAASSLTPEQWRRLQLLEARRIRIEDINAIKRLQRAYGYYVDEGQWDDVADLFTADGRIELGLDGVYIGRDRVRQYLRTLGNGKNGLQAGQLNEHFQLMPVVTLSADGTRARGTWRAVILGGQLGGPALWGEGPYENEYVKENGVWKLKSVHWFQTVLSPYEGGWAKHADANGAKFISAQLPADAPPTVTYPQWPGTFTPPFHFRGQYPGLMPIAQADIVSTATNLTDVSAFTRQIAALDASVSRLADQDAIENLQRIYGFYIDKGLWSEAAALFTDNAEFVIQGLGSFRGPEGVLRYYRAVGPEGLQSGRLYDQMQLQPIVHVSADGRSAQGRWHWFAQLASQGQFHEWATGVYENRYVKRDGVWRIQRLHLYPTMITPYEDGWAKTSLPRSRFEANVKPDQPHSGPISTYDKSFVVPFHFAHPVRSPTSGTRGSDAFMRAARVNAIGAGASAVDAALNRLEAQLAAVEDRASIENVQTVYGYYLATLLWDELADLFAEDGTIEIAMRGIYVGKPAVRRNLNLYGQAGLDHGVLHNHMQFQPVIHVSADGRTAKLRSRALSMMGNFERNASWMGGTYENTFEKIDGRWRFKTDQQINTYFAPYETGWKDLAQRPPPGITASNPPDLPPSFSFDLYPKNFLPPYHYANPVTGKRFAGTAP